MSILISIYNYLRQLAQTVANAHGETLSQLRSQAAQLQALNASLTAQNAALTQQVVSMQSELTQILNLLLLSEAASFRFDVAIDGHTTFGATMFTLTDSQQATITLSPVDAKGAPASLDGAPVWASSDETIATVAAATDGLSAVLTSIRPGTCTVTATGDADLTSGVTPINGTLDVTVVAGAAIQITLTASDPTDHTPAA